jgi:anti-sigma regulatory factor (Ser/Thr protein kinase)
MDSDFRLVIRSDPRLLGSIRCLIRGWTEGHGVASDVAENVVLAIDEACSNAMRHAYRGQCDEEVQLTLRADESWLEYELEDYGMPCPAECLDVASRRVPSTDDVTPGGLGVLLMFEVFDEVDFQPGSDRGNRVTMRLRRIEAGMS